MECAIKKSDFLEKLNPLYIAYNSVISEKLLVTKSENEKYLSPVPIKTLGKKSQEQEPEIVEAEEKSPESIPQSSILANELRGEIILEESPIDFSKLPSEEEQPPEIKAAATTEKNSPASSVQSFSESSIKSTPSPASQTPGKSIGTPVKPSQGPSIFNETLRVRLRAVMLASEKDRWKEEQEELWQSCGLSFNPSPQS